MATDATLDAQLTKVSINIDDDSDDSLGDLSNSKKKKKNNSSSPKFQQLPDQTLTPTSSRDSHQLTQFKTCHWSNLSKQQKTIYCLLIFILLLIIVLIITIIYYENTLNTKSSNNNLCDNNNDNNNNTSSPKNVILMIGDGMGTIYNTAYRLYKKQDKTILDKIYKGRYSTDSSNHTITDSAAGAFAFSAGMKTVNGHIGTDAGGNPIGTILEAAKRLHKGTGLIATKSITDATPASFAAHTLQRDFHKLISKQLATLHMNYEWNNFRPIVDIMMGGGKQWFDEWNFNQTNYNQYGWNKLFYDTDTLYQLTVDDMPLIGLFADDRFPYYLDIINDDVPYPTLVDMARVSIDLLNEKYNEDGFFLMIESSRIDSCGHANDIACLLNEVDSFYETVDYVLNWAEADNDTLVVVLADHQTGGLAIGREDVFIKSKLQETRFGNAPKNDSYIEYYGDFVENSLTSSSNTEYDISYLSLWRPDIVNDIKHSAQWLNDTYIDLNMTFDSLLQLIETNWFILSDQEKSFINFTFTNNFKMDLALSHILSVRTQSGWTTLGHTAVDVSLYAYGVSADSFIGHWRNDEIGQLLTEILDCKDEQDQQTELLEQLWFDGTLQLCDPTNKLEFVEWNKTVPYPFGNKLYPQNCVDEWQ